MQKTLQSLSLTVFSALVACSGSPPPAPSPYPTFEEAMMPAPANGYQVTMGPFHVPVGEEIQLCQTMKLPNEQPVAMSALKHRHTLGSHHFILFKSKYAVPDQVFPCWGVVNFEQWEFVADIQQDKELEWTLPADSGITLEPHQQIMVQVHYVNARTVKTADNLGFAVLNLETKPMSEVKHRIGSLFTVNTGISIPPHSEKTIHRDCIFSQTARLVAMTGHFHARGTLFSVQPIGPDDLPTGEVIYSNSNWEDALFKTFDMFKERSIYGVRFSCSYRNDTDETVVWGSHADVQEHCNLFFHYTPDQLIDGAGNKVDTEPSLVCVNGSGGW